MTGNHNIKWTVKRTPDGWTGEATVSIAPGAAVSARARGRTRADAASRTFAALDAVTRSPLVSALLPPGAAPALRAAKTVAQSVARLLRRRRRRTTVSGVPMHIAVGRALRARGAPPALCRLGEVLAR